MTKSFQKIHLQTVQFNFSAKRQTIEEASSLTKFAIVGIRRTGTTLIRTTLNNHPDIKCYGEVFNFGRRFKRRRGHRCEGSYRRHINCIPFGHIRDAVNRPSTVQAFLDQLYTNTDSRSVGFKLTMTQKNRFPNVMDYFKQHEIHVIQVIRRNILKTLVSRSVKKVTGQSHTTTGMQKTQINLEIPRLLPELERFDCENSQWEKDCAGLPFMKVYYEDFVADKSQHLEEMLHFLNEEVRQDIGSNLKKGNPDNLSEIILNYDEVHNHLTKSRFAWCLEG